MDAARKTTRITVSPETRALVRPRLMERKAEIEAHFGIAVTRVRGPAVPALRDGRLLRRAPGRQHAHGVGRLALPPHLRRHLPHAADRKKRRRTRTAAASWSSTAPTARPARVPASAAPGSLVTFRAETTHEVTPVTHGVRYTIATWFR